MILSLLELLGLLTIVTFYEYDTRRSISTQMVVDGPAIGNNVPVCSPVKSNAWTLQLATCMISVIYAAQITEFQF